MKTAQEILDEGVAFILAQSQRCAVPGRGPRCTYITPEGQRCVAGNFMSEALCKLVEDNQGGGPITDVTGWLEDGTLNGDFEADFALLKQHDGLLEQLQALHDDWSDRTETAPAEKVQRLAFHALVRGLTMPKHERLGNLSEVAS